MRKSRLKAASLSAKAKAKISSEYRRGAHCVELSKKHDLSPGFIIQIVKEAQIPIRGRSHYYKLSPDSKAALIRDYAAGASTTEVAKKYGIKGCSAWELLKRRGLTRPNDGKGAKKYEINESAFDKITEESAYWIGFLMTDGCVTQTNGTPTGIKLAIGGRDEAHIRKLRDFLKSTHPITTSPGGRRIIAGRPSFCGPISILAIVNARLAKSLVRYGVVPHKTRIAKVKLLQNNRHFWRGCVDGDGSMMLGKGRDIHGVRPAIMFCSASPHLIQQFMRFVRTVVPSWRCRGPSLDGNTQSVCISSMSALLLTRLLYGNCRIALDRKMETASKVLKISAKDKYWLKRSQTKATKRSRGIAIKRGWANRRKKLPKTTQLPTNS